MQLHEVKGKVDFAIITILKDELEAVRACFQGETIESPSLVYEFRRVPVRGGSALVAIARANKQGNLAAQALAQQMIDELDPHWILLVGIAGGIPDSKYTLGDVVLATHINDLTVHAVYENARMQYAISGGPLSKEVTEVVTGRSTMEQDFRGWNTSEAIRVSRPPVVWSTPGAIYGDPGWQNKVQESLEKQAARQNPIAVDGPLFSSDTLVKDTQTVQQWLDMARNTLAVEMESAGVLRAARDGKREYPFLPIRGISDIVGLKRDDAWAIYACHSAAAYALALVKSGRIKRFQGERRHGPPLAPPFQGHFVGRQDELSQLRQALLGASAETQQAVSIVGLHGLGGIGKTALATQFAHQHQGEFLGGVFSADLGTNRDQGERGVDRNPAAALRGALEQWAGQLELESFRDTSTNQLMGCIQTSLEKQRRRGRVLVVLDNVDSRETLEPMLKIAAHCSILVTTRQEHLATEYGLTPIRLGGFSRAASLEYLAHCLPHQNLSAPGIEELLDYAMDHPLAVKLISELARQQNMTPGNLLKQLQRASAGDEKAELSAKMLQRLHDCFRVSIKNLPRRALRPLLISLASQSPVSFPLEAAAYVSGWGSKARTRDGLQELVDWGLVEALGEERFKIHRLLCDYLRVAHGRDGFGRVKATWEVTSLAWLLPSLRLPLSAGLAVYDTRQEAWFLRYAIRHQNEPAALRKEWDGILLGIARRSALGVEGSVRKYLHALGDYLQDADFSDMALGRVILDGAHLERARFEGTELSGTAPRLWPTQQEYRETVGRMIKSRKTQLVLLNLPVPFFLLALASVLKSDGLRVLAVFLFFFPVGGAAVLGENLSHLLLSGGRALDGTSYGWRIFWERLVAAAMSTLFGAAAMVLVAVHLVFVVLGVPQKDGWSLHADDFGGWLVSVLFSGGLLLVFGLTENWLSRLAIKHALGGLGRRLISCVSALALSILATLLLIWAERAGWVGSIAYGVVLVGLFFMLYGFLGRNPEGSASLYSLHTSYLRDAKLQDANLRRAGLRWCNFQRAQLHRALMEGAQLQHADLTDAQLVEANLEGANLEEANLTRADLRGAMLGGAVLSGATLTGARLEGASYDSRTRWPEGFEPLAVKGASTERGQTHTTE
ncbi:pentapeptide repeat-containing protein [Vitiosangium sp. GDMCC 1.1324]|uniref:pentapeptide repeat-containing protein n=1 Tax=Vitiosangium sp. (strain GDMCC 1.1324) TaxID=2138576 RepID=UPI000D3BD4FE|nr:pentapeptide repeat-containing protein [Vitiosangium sp. GDMCC 1.1324]PTL75474.1 hypothetical protein DAT35_54405 [Vitiosangium sp. GDMCC 1.1324]